MKVYIDVFGSLRCWHSEVRTLEHKRLYLGANRSSRDKALVDASIWARENGFSLSPKPVLMLAAGEALSSAQAMAIDFEDTVPPPAGDRPGDRA